MANKFSHIDYSGVLSLFDRYITSVKLDQHQQERVQAAHSILREVDFLSHEIIDRNNELTARKEHSLIAIDAWTVPSTTAGAFWSDRPARETDQYRLEMRLQVDTKSFYRTAWTLIEVLKNLPNLNKLDSKPVHRVRNELVDHADKITRESFQYSDIVGPQIKGPRTNDQASTSPHDAGFVPNSEVFVRDLTAALENASPRETPKTP